MPFNHLILCHPPFFLPSIFPSIRVFSNELALCIRWPKYWSFSFSISPSNEYSGLISFRTDWFDLLAVQGTLKSLLQHHSSKASILLCSAFFMVQLSHPYMTPGKIVHCFFFHPHPLHPKTSMPFQVCILNFSGFCFYFAKSLNIPPPAPPFIFWTSAPHTFSAIVATRGLLLDHLLQGLRWTQSLLVTTECCFYQASSCWAHGLLSLLGTRPFLLHIGT